MEDSLWLQLETRVRKLIKDLIEPTIDRGNKQKKLMKGIEKTNDELKNRLDGHEVQVSKLLGKIDLIDGYSRTLMEFEAGLRLVEARYQFDNESMRAELDSFQKRLTSSEETVQVLDNQRIDMQNDLEKCFSITSNHRVELDDMINKLNDDLKFIKSESDYKSQEFEMNINSINESLNKISHELGNTEIIAKKGDKMYSQLKEQFKNFNRVLKSVTNDSKDQVEKIRQMAMQFDAKASEDNKRLRDYIDKEYQLSCFLSNSDILHGSFLDFKSKRSLAEIEQIKYVE